MRWVQKRNGCATNEKLSFILQMNKRKTSRLRLRNPILDRIEKVTVLIVPSTVVLLAMLLERLAPHVVAILHIPSAQIKT